MAVLELEAPAAATELDVLYAARELYAQSPAHGLPQITNAATGEQSHCLISAVCAAGFALRAPLTIKSACKRLAGLADVIVAGLPGWEAAHRTDEALGLFDDAIGSAR